VKTGLRSVSGKKKQKLDKKWRKVFGPNRYEVIIADGERGLGGWIGDYGRY